MIGNTKRGGDDKVSEGVHGRFIVTIFWCPLVGRKEGQDSICVSAG